jgi:hypothetical protein
MYIYTQDGERSHRASEDDVSQYKRQVVIDATHLAHKAVVEAAAAAFCKHLSSHTKNAASDARLLAAVTSAIDGYISDALGDLCGENDILDEIEEQD